MAEEFTSDIDEPSNMELERVMRSLMSPLDSLMSPLDSLMSPLDSGRGSVVSDSVSSADKGEVCPLCKEELQHYQISFTSKFRMCGSLSCEYPFNLAKQELGRVHPSAPGASAEDSGAGESCDEAGREGALDVHAYLDASDSEPESDGEEGRLARLVRQTARLAGLLRRRQEGAREDAPLTDARYVRRLLELGRRRALLSREERALVAERPPAGLQVSIRLPQEPHRLVEIDILQA